MLNDASGFKRIFLAAGFTDLRRGIDGLAGIIQFQFELDPHDKDTIFYSYGAFTLQQEELIQRGVSEDRIYCYGVAFKGKQVVIKMGK